MLGPSWAFRTLGDDGHCGKCRGYVEMNSSSKGVVKGWAAWPFVAAGFLLFVVVAIDYLRAAPLRSEALLEGRKEIIDFVTQAGSQRLIVVSIVVYAAVFSSLRLTRRERRSPHVMFRVALLWIFAGLALIGYRADYQQIASEADVLVLLVGITLGQALLVGNLSRSQISRLKFVLITFLPAVCIAGLFHPDWRGLVWGLTYSYRDLPRTTGPFLNPNHFGELMAAGCIIAGGLLLRRYGVASRCEQSVSMSTELRIRYSDFLWGAVLITGLGLLKSLSRGAWLGGTLGGAYLAYCWWRLRQQQGRHGAEKKLISSTAGKAVCIAVISVAVTAFWLLQKTEHPLLRRIASVRNVNDFSARNRLTSYRDCLQMMADKPITGFGWARPETSYDAFYLANRMQSGAAMRTNDYLVIGVALGLPALATLLGYIWVGFASQHRSWSTVTATASDDEREEFWLKCICRAGALVLITTFFLDGGFFKIALAVPFWILLELGCAPPGRPSVKELVENDPAPQIVRDANIESVPNPEAPSGFRWFSTGAFRIGRWVLWAFLIISVIQVAALSFVNPATTGPIVVRWASGLVSRQPTPPARYDWISLENVPAWFLRAVWVTEDPRFFGHHGFDWEQVQNAIEEASRTGRPSRGASTISMQCARSTFLWQGRSWIRKGLEAYYTKLMELMWSKGRILEVYANVIEFGEGIYGIEAAAQYHFGIRARDLSPEQAAALVAILPNPRNWNPKKPNERVVRRIEMILQRSAEVRLPIEAN